MRAAILNPYVVPVLLVFPGFQDRPLAGFGWIVADSGKQGDASQHVNTSLDFTFNNPTGFAANQRMNQAPNALTLRMGLRCVLGTAGWIPEGSAAVHQGALADLADDLSLAVAMLLHVVNSGNRIPLRLGRSTCGDVNF